MNLDRTETVSDDGRERYATVTDCTGRTLVCDRENADAWVRSNLAVDVAAWR